MKRLQGPQMARLWGIDVLVLASLFAAAPAVAAVSLHVSAAAARGGDGSKARPFRSLRKALGKAPSGATVRVAAGVYRGNLLVRGRTVELLGGYSADFARRAPRSLASVLQGNGKDAVLTLLAAGSSLIDGFVIKGGGGSKRRRPHYIYGGGVYVEGGQVTIAHCRIEGNRTRGKPAEQAGGGVYATAGVLTLRENVIHGNHSKRGGGVALLEMRRALLEGNTISANVAEGDHGGGVYAAGKDLRFVANLVRDNEVGRPVKYGWGGGITVIGKGTKARMSKNVLTNNYAASLGSAYFIDDESDAVLSDELIYRNRCAPEGGTAIYVDGLDPRRGSRARIERSTIVSHPCAGQRAGNAVRGEQGSRVEIIGSVLWDNGAKELTVDRTSRLTISRSLVQGKQVRGSGLVHAAPRFRDAKRGDYRLAAPVAGQSFGVAWDPAEQQKKPAVPRAKASELAPKTTAVSASAAASSQPSAPASRPSPTATKSDGCALNPGSRDLTPSGLLVLALALLAGLRRRG